MRGFSRPAPIPYRRAVLMALALGSLGGCATIRQFTALSQVHFAFDRVSDVRLAGVSTSGKNDYSDLKFDEVARLAAAVAAREVPIEFLVHVRAENPASNATTARLMKLDWTFFLDEARVVDGAVDRGYSFEPGKPADVPVAISFDAYSMVENSGQDLFELALAIAGVEGYRKNVRLDLAPTIDTDLGPIRYPTPVTIRRDVGTGSN